MAAYFKVSLPFCSASEIINLGESYPAAAASHVHTTKAYLPLDIARALSIDPSLVQKPVETFYTRDAIQLRVSAPSSTLNRFYMYFAGCSSHDTVPSALFHTYHSQNDKTSIRTTSWTKVLPPKNIWSV